MEENFPFEPSEIPRLLLAWYEKSGRDFPWRETRDPYRIWLSEVMLQQTGVKTVIPYYERFLERFPNAADLAAASVDEVIELWAGLGYYSRARNLHAAARKVAGELDGVFPESLEGIMALPGVGRSTAGAILSIAFDRKAPILDGNVRRVLCRLFALREDPRSTASEKKLWVWADALTPEDRPHDYAQAIMDLGATVCLPRSPLCESCPLQVLCQAKLRGLETEIPVKRKKKAIPTVARVALILSHQGRYLVCKRPLEGMLGGLWEFPTAEVGEREPKDVASGMLSGLGLIVEGTLEETEPVRHLYSHFRLDLRLYRGTVSAPMRVAEGEECRWLSLEELGDFPLHGAHKKALKHIRST